MKKLSLLGYYGAQNLGDELLLNALIEELLRKEKVKLNVFTQNASLTKANLKNLEIQTTDKFNPFLVLTELLNSNALIFGGGSIFQDVSSLKSLIYYSFIAFMAKLFGKKVILLAQGIGPFKTPFAQALCKQVYKASNFISVRDKASFNLCEKWGVKVLQGADLAWLLPSGDKIQTIDNLSIVISLRESKELTIEKLKIFSDFLKLTHLNCKFHLIAFQPADKEVLNTLKQELEGQATIHELYTPRDWTETGEKLFNSASVAYCMRFHALLLSIKLGSRTFAISYDPKLEALSKIFNLPCLNLSELSLKNLNKLYSSHFPIKEEMQKTANEQVFLARQQINAMWEVING